MFTELAQRVLLLGTLPPPARLCSHSKKEVVVATCSFSQGKGRLLTDVSVGHWGTAG